MWPFTKPMVDELDPEFAATAPSGVDGLDQILGGGFLRGDMHLVQGATGSGKTTLALQFLRAGVRAGEPGLFITLAQSRPILERIARSHGIPLDGIAIHELFPTSIAGPPAPQTVLHTADVELGEVIRGIRETVERVKPQRVVFDSLGTFHQFIGSTHRFRAEIVSLRQLLIGGNCTTIFIGDHPVEGDAIGQTPDNEFHGLAASVVHLDQTSRDYGEVRRRLRVIKVRGLPHRGGYHNFRIRTGGMQAFPRLSPFQTPGYSDFRPVASRIKELDNLLGGGLELGTACLLIGPSGSGKSTLASVYAHAVAKAGDPVAILLFEERPETFLARAKGVGVDLRSDVASGLVLLHQMDTGDISPGELSQGIRDLVEEGAAQVVILDSLTGYFNAMVGDEMLVEQMHDLLNYLSRRGILTILTVTQEGMPSVGTGPAVDISYLSDTIILLRQFEDDGKIRRCLVAIKKRHGEHDTTIREWMITSQGVSLGAPLTHLQDVLTGRPRPDRRS